MMKKLIITAVLVAALLPTSAFALRLTWDPVTLDVDGNVLSPGNAVIGYKVYRCQSNNCNLGNAGPAVGTVTAPTTEFNIDALPKPSTYFVTAFNISGESVESLTVRVTPPRAPQNLRGEP